MPKERRQVEWSVDLGNMRARAGQFVSEMMGEPVETKRVTLREAKDEAKSAAVEINFSVGRASIKALPLDSEDLFVARLEYVGEIEYEVSGDAHRIIRLRQKGDFPREMAAAIGNKQDLHWDIGLAQNLPLRLQLRGGVGKADIDLSRLRVSDFKMDTGVGEAHLALGGAIAARINGGVGKTAIAVAAGTSGELKISGGVGECAVSVAPESALRLQAKTGLGQINLPEHFKRRGKRADRGFGGGWETAGFAEAEKQLVIEYGGGIGSFKLDYEQPTAE